MIYAFDPGKVTGVAALGGFDSFGRFTSFEVPDFFLWLKEESPWIDGTTTLIFERFDISERTAKLSRQTEALDYIGAIKYVGRHAGAKVISSGRDAKGFSTDAKLKAIDWYNATSGGHANDAARHLLRHLACTVHDGEILKKLGEAFG